jgi:hypothetical protein
VDCCHVSRRQALRWAGLVAATPLVAGAIDAAPAVAAGTPAAGDLLVTDLEVVTVTDTSVVLTWFTGSSTAVDQYSRPAPVPADTEVLLGTPGSTAPLTTVLADQTPTAFHYAEVTGLEPGRPYTFAARSAGVAAAYSSLQFPGPGGSVDAPYTFTTLTPPPGRHLFTIALSNDWHHGEETSGIITGNFPPAFQQDAGLPPYTEVMAQATLADVRQPDRGAHGLIVAGDLTAEAASTDAQQMRQLLDSFGTLGHDYFVARGNHDRPHVGTTYDTCTVVPAAPDHHDCWGDAFGYRRQQLNTGQLGGLRLVGLDTTTLDDANGELVPAQLAQLTETLARDPERPTLVFGHHPITWESAVTTAAGPTFNLDPGNARSLESLYARHPGVFFHHSGHTHRNRRTFAGEGDGGQGNPRVEYLEVAATKEYPGGYALLKVYSGGYQVNFYKTRSDLARQWSQRTRGEYFGIYPHYTLGTIADRNHTVVRDLSGLHLA